MKAVKESGRRNMCDEKKGKGKGEEESKPACGGFARNAGNLKNAVVAEKNRFGLNDPKGEGDKSEKEGVVGEESCEDEKTVKKEGEKIGCDVKLLQGISHHDGGDEGVGHRPDFQVGGADEELRWSGFEEDKVEFSIANRFGEFHQSGHEKGGKDLLDELICRDENDHLGTTPAGDRVDVVIDNVDEGKLERKPGKLDDDPDKEVGPKGQFASCGVAELDQPKAKKMKEGSHLIRRQQCIFAGQPSKGGERG